MMNFHMCRVPLVSAMHVYIYIYVTSGRPPGALGGPCLALHGFLGNFIFMRFGHTTSEARHLLLNFMSSTMPRHHV